MNIQLVIQDNNTGQVHDITNLVSDISHETWLSGQPGKLTFKFLRPEQNTAFFYEGSVVYLKAEGIDLFYGYVFTKSRDKEQIITVTAYDQLRYLKNHDTYTFKNMTSSEIFKKICDDFQLRYKIVDESAYKIEKVTYDDRSLASMLQNALDRTLAYKKKRYMIRDNFGTLEHLDLEKLQTNLIIGDGSLLTDYAYTSSIDSEVYNQVKLIQDNQKTKKRDVYIVKNSQTIDRWGVLQYHERMDESVNAAEIKERADNLLKIYNTVRRSLSLDCLGDFRVTAGTGLQLSIKELGDLNLNQFCTVESCKRTLMKDYHKMTLEVGIWLANG